MGTVHYHRLSPPDQWPPPVCPTPGPWPGHAPKWQLPPLDEGKGGEARRWRIGCSTQQVYIYIYSNTHDNHMLRSPPLALLICSILMASEARILLCLRPSALLMADSRAPVVGFRGHMTFFTSQQPQASDSPSDSRMLALFRRSASTCVQQQRYQRGQLTRASDDQNLKFPPPPPPPPPAFAWPPSLLSATECLVSRNACRGCPRLLQRG